MPINPPPLSSLPPYLLPFYAPSIPPFTSPLPFPGPYPTLPRPSSLLPSPPYLLHVSEYGLRDGRLFGKGKGRKGRVKGGGKARREEERRDVQGNTCEGEYVFSWDTKQILCEVVILAKQYIHYKRIHNESPTLVTWLLYCYMVKAVELAIAKQNDTLTQWLEKWEPN